MISSSQDALNSTTCKKSALTLCREVAIPVMAKRVAGVSTQLEFLRLIVGSLKMEIKLPDDKLGHLQVSLAPWLARKSCKKRDLLSLIGHLHHTSSVIKPGRPWRKIDLAAS